MSHLIQKKHKKPPQKLSGAQRVIVLRVLCLLMLARTSQALFEPLRQTLAGKRFKSINNFGMEETNLYSIATTSTGEVYSITSTNANTNPTQYTFEARDSTATYPHQVLNAIHLNKDYVFTLVQHSTTNKVNYQLFKAKTTGTVNLKADSKASSFAEAQSSAAADIVNNNLEILPIGGTRLYMIYMIAIANTGVELLRFSLDQSEILPYTGTSGYFLTTEKVLKTAFVFDARSSKISFAYTTQHTSPVEQRVHHSHLQSTQLDYSTGLSVPAPTTDFTGKNALIAHHGIRYGLLGNGQQNTIDFETIIFYMDKTANPYHKISLLKLSNWGTVIKLGVNFNNLDYNAINAIGMESVTHTRYVCVVTCDTSTGCYSQGGGAFSHGIYLAKQIWTFFGSSGISVKYEFQINGSGVFPFSGLYIINRDGTGLMVADWNSDVNIMYLGDALGYSCPSGQTRDEPGSGCYPVGTLRTNCKRVLGVYLRCLECNDPSGGVTYSLVKSETFTKPNDVACKPSNLNCGHSTGQYIDASGLGCYDCASQVPGCTRCNDFSVSCTYDGCLDSHSFYLLSPNYEVGGCKTKCSVSNCDVCVDQGTDKCLTCKNLFYPSNSLQACVGCTNLDPKCTECSFLNTCKKREPGFYLTSSSNFDARTCTRCPNGFTTIGNGCQE